MYRGSWLGEISGCFLDPKELPKHLQGASWEPLGGSSGSQGVGTSSQKIYADLLDEIYGGPSVSVERGTLGVVLDKSSFNTFVHWMPKGPRWWIFPEEYNIVSTTKKNTTRISGSH